MPGFFQRTSSSLLRTIASTSTVLGILMHHCDLTTDALPVVGSQTYLPSNSTNLSSSQLSSSHKNIIWFSLVGLLLLMSCAGACYAAPSRSRSNQVDADPEAGERRIENTERTPLAPNRGGCYNWSTPHRTP